MSFNHLVYFLLLLYLRGVISCLVPLWLVVRLPVWQWICMSFCLPAVPSAHLPMACRSQRIMGPFRTSCSILGLISVWFAPVMLNIQEMTRPYHVNEYLVSGEGTRLVLVSTYLVSWDTGNYLALGGTSRELHHPRYGPCHL